jgi:hypothetical protein
MFMSFTLIPSQKEWGEFLGSPYSIWEQSSFSLASIKHLHFPYFCHGLSISFLTAGHWTQWMLQIHTQQVPNLGEKYLQVTISFQNQATPLMSPLVYRPLFHQREVFPES